MREREKDRETLSGTVIPWSMLFSFSLYTCNIYVISLPIAYRYAAPLVLLSAGLTEFHPTVEVALRGGASQGGPHGSLPGEVRACALQGSPSTRIGQRDDFSLAWY